MKSAGKIALLVFLVMSLFTTAKKVNAGTLFMHPPRTYTDNSPITPCDQSGQPSGCAKSFKLYVSQNNSSEVYPTPTVAAQSVPAERTSWCVENQSPDLPVYGTMQVVYWDDSVSTISQPAFWLPGNIVGRDYSLYNSAANDGLDLIYLRRRMGVTVTQPNVTLQNCPHISGTDFPQITITDDMAADINLDGIIDGLDLILFRRKYFGIFAQ